MISIKPISAYYSDSDRAIFSHKQTLLTTAKRLHSELGAVEAILIKGDIPDTDKESRVASLIAGEKATRSEPLTKLRTELQLGIRDIEDALDLVVRKEGKAKYEAGARLAKDITKQHLSGHVGQLLGLRQRGRGHDAERCAVDDLAGRRDHRRQRRSPPPAPANCVR